MFFKFLAVFNSIPAATYMAMWVPNGSILLFEVDLMLRENAIEL
jgi:hypothetical protein